MPWWSRLLVDGMGAKRGFISVSTTTAVLPGTPSARLAPAHCRGSVRWYHMTCQASPSSPTQPSRASPEERILLSSSGYAPEMQTLPDPTVNLPSKHAPVTCRVRTERLKLGPRIAGLPPDL